MALNSVSVASITTDSGSSGTDFVTNDPSLSVTLNYNNVGNNVVFVWVAGGAFATPQMLGTTGRLSNLANGTVTVTLTNANLAGGDYTILVGTSNTVPPAGAGIRASHALTVDTAVLPPAGLTLVSDSGTPGDNITNVGLPTISGTGEAGATVTLHDGAATLGTGTVGAGGTWSVTATTALTAGANTLTATQTDLAGNLSGDSAPLNVTLDATAPNAPLITLVTDDVPLGTGPLTNGASTNDTDLTVLVGVATTGAVAGDTIQLYDGAGTSIPRGSHILSAGDIGNGSADVQTGVLATPGAYNITARVLDQAGNLSDASPIVTVTEDASAVCYVAGTRILAATGERVVESLMQGDIVLTLSGGELSAQPVKWVGRRRIDLTAHPRPETVAPIRIQHDAFADNMPHRDLLVSPDHAIFVDNRLICARQLINGTTIRQENLTAVEYFHVELDAHAILLAEGLPAESYIDTGNHGFFTNSGEPLVLHPDLTDESGYPSRQAGSCAPFVWDEATVRPVWQRLADRAAALGQPAPVRETTTDPGLQVVTKGRTIRPIFASADLAIFVLPRGASEVGLVSRAASPTDVRPWLEDRRRLGVRVARIVLRGADEVREIPVDHPDLGEGWWAIERDGQLMSRWTNGEAVLPLPAKRGDAMLEIHLAGTMTYVVEAAPVDEAARRVA